VYVSLIYSFLMSRVVTSCMNSLVIHISLLGSWGAILFSLVFPTILFSSLFFMVTDNFFLDTFMCGCRLLSVNWEKKLLSISSCVFKAWAGRIGVQIFIFLCVLKEGLKKCSFSSSLYICIFCPAGFEEKRWVC